MIVGISLLLVPGFHALYILLELVLLGGNVDYQKQQIENIKSFQIKSEHQCSFSLHKPPPILILRHGMKVCQFT